MHMLQTATARPQLQQTSNTKMYLQKMNKHLPITKPCSRAHTVHTQPTQIHTYTHFQGTVGAIRGMFGLCYLNKQKLAVLPVTAGLIILLFQPKSIQHTTRCGGLPLRHTHTPGCGPVCTHTHKYTQMTAFIHRQCIRLVKQPQRYKGGQRETYTVSHS